MAVAHWKRLGEEDVGPKQIHPPKEASFKGWWNACRKAMPELPLWMAMKGVMRYTADEETISFEWLGGDLMIARKRNLR
jgi:hypothetical protein